MRLSYNLSCQTDETEQAVTKIANTHMPFPTWKVHTLLGALGCPFLLILRLIAKLCQIAKSQHAGTRISSQNWHLSAVTFSADTLKVSKAARVLHIGGRARERATERSEAKNARSHRGYIEVASYTTVRAPHRASGSFSVGRRCLQNPQLDFSTSGLFTSEEAGGHGGGFEERRGCRREQGTNRVITHLEITSEAPNGVRSHRAVYTPRISDFLGTHRRRTC